MMSFKYKNSVPIGGRYFYEVNGVPVFAYERGPMKAAVTAEMRNQGIEPAPENLWELIQDFMCRRLPEGFCDGDLDGKPRARVVTIPSVRRDTMKLVALSRGRATRQQATLNADKCLSCEKNNKSMCSSCVGINKWAATLVGLKEVPAAFRWLGLCEADGTSLVAKVALESLPANEAQTDECWANKELTNGG